MSIFDPAHILAQTSSIDYALSGSEFVHKLFNPIELLTTTPLQSAIVPTILVIIFVETGLLFPILPGDSLLFAGGILAAQGIINPLWLLVAAPIAAIAGDHCGYFIGRCAGNVLFTKEDSRFFKKEYLERSHDFFEKNGNFAIILARFVPIVRTFTAVIAGTSKMRYSTFALYDVIGGILWTVGISSLGMWLGQNTFVKENIENIAIAIVIVSILPGVWKWYHNRKKSSQKSSSAKNLSSH